MNKHKSGGVSILGVLLVVFIVLKLTGLISWKWVWVLSPLWAMIILTLIGFITIILTYLTIKDK